MTKRDGDGDLSVTALYTAHAWMWGGLDGADLFATRRSRDVFNATNLALGTARIVRRDLPSLRHGLVQRHVMIDRMLAASGCAQVLELAAGLSRRGASFSADPALRYVEVDLPAMIAEKRALLDASERGRQVAARPNLILVAADVAELDLAAQLVDGPVFVIAEGLLVYLPAAEQDALWRRIAAVVRARPGSAFAFDLVPPGEQPPPGRVGRALESVMKRFTRGRTFATDGRSRADLTAQLGAAGFTTVEALEPAAAPAAWSIPHLAERTQIVVWRVS
jgi:O-methyltransferase involved in polyketide biosynthesis